MAWNQDRRDLDPERWIVRQTMLMFAITVAAVAVIYTITRLAADWANTVAHLPR